MIKADVLVNNNDWKKYISNPNIYLNKKLKKIEKKINLFKKKKLNFTLLLSGDVEIKKLNKQFRKKNKSTDVLSFPCHENLFLYKLISDDITNIYLGDIIINLSKIIEQSKKEDFFTVFDKIWVHGLTHLLGHRHESNRDFAIMHKLENKIIKSIQ